MCTVCVCISVSEKYISEVRKQMMRIGIANVAGDPLPDVVVMITLLLVVDRCIRIYLSLEKCISEVRKQMRHIGMADIVCDALPAVEIL